MQTSHDAILVLSFGGPEGPDDVMPFLRNVTSGRQIPDERLQTVAKQYELFGGRSPINAQNRELIAALEVELAAHGIDLPVYFGNRNWQPYLTDTVQQMANDGITSALVFVTSAFGSNSGCRQYRDDLAAAAAAVDNAPNLQKLRLFYNHPGFLEPVTERVRSALAANPDATLLFTAHSIPNVMAQTSDYEAQLRSAAGLVVEMLGADAPDHWELVFQSRSGPPAVPWLEPDVVDRLQALASTGTSAVTLCPLGFISDHMEVLFDLDTQAKEAADKLGISLNRSATVGTDHRFVTMIVQLIEEQLADAPRLFLGPDGPWPDACPEGHCAYTPRPHGPSAGPGPDAGPGQPAARPT